MSLQERLGFSTEPIFLIDGHAFIYRGFYAYPDFQRADGFPTSALFSICKLVLKILKEERPGHMLFITDGKKKTFRSEIYPDYKAQRPKMPETLACQIEPLRGALGLLGIPVLEAEDGEADDCLASLAARFKGTHPVVIVGADKDLRQCLDKNVFLWDPSAKKEKILTEELFREESELSPGQWPDYQAMIGDSADNIPGIPKVGPKTAMGFLRRYPSLEALRENFDRLTAKEQTLLAPHMEQVFLYKKLTTLRTDLCQEFAVEDVALKEANIEEFLEFLADYEFRSLRKEFLALFTPKAGEKQAIREPAQNSAQTVRRQISDLASCAGKDVGLWYQNKRFLLAFDGEEKEYTGSVQELWKALSSARIFVPSLKELLESLETVPEGCIFFDTELAAYLMSPEERDYRVEHIFKNFRDQFEEEPVGPVHKLLLVGQMLFRHLGASDLLGLFEDMELPLTRVLVRMQKRGIAIDLQKFSEFLGMVQEELDRLTRQIYTEAGREFNIRSSQQLAEILFTDLDLHSKQKTPKGAPSTSSAALDSLKDAHPVVEDVLQFRMYEKLRSTYLKPLPAMTDADGRIHTTFNQLATATGRLSSSGPNLQNIPVRGPLGARMRSCFVSRPGNFLVAADYSQIELRVLAHMSADPTLCAAFREGEDIHTRTASLLFDTENVTADERRKAKTINFGLLYGMGPQKLGRELGISLKEAKEFITNYFSKLTRVKEFYEEIETSAREVGYVTTLAGRRRLLPDIHSRNANLVQQARRMAINTVVQGSAADIIKKAMLEVDTSQELTDLGAELILQIHDELLLESGIAEAPAVGKAVQRIMTSVYTLDVPLVVDWGYSENWGAAH